MKINRSRVQFPKLSIESSILLNNEVLHIYQRDHFQGLRLARELKDDYSIGSMANYSAYALLLGGRIPYTLGEIKALRAEADNAFKRAKKYISKQALACSQYQIVDRVRGVGGFTS